MKEIRYLSKNKYGFSIDDIKKEHLNINKGSLFVFSGYSKKDGHLKIILKISKIKSNKNKEFYNVSFYKQLTNSTLHSEAFPVSDGILSLRENIKKIINQLGGIKSSVIIKKEILEDKELNMKIQKLGTKHPIKVFIVEKNGLVIQCEGISDIYSNVQLSSIGYNEVEKYKNELGKYIGYEGEAKDLVDEFGPYTIYIKDIEVEI